MSTELLEEFMTRKDREDEERVGSREQDLVGENDEIMHVEEENDGPRGVNRVKEKRTPKALEKRGPADGVVLPLTQKGDGFYDSFYTLDVSIGTPPIVFPLLVDTGSSDLWIASPECGCTPLSYNPSTSSTSSTLPYTLTAQYLLGSLSGPLYTDTLSIGPYTLPHQALCGATQVAGESMGLGFSGIVGLGLAGMSLIEDLLGGGVGGRGAPVLVNLFDGSVLVGGEGSVPRERWFSLVLDRPGFDEDDVPPPPTDSSSNSTPTSSTSSTTSSSSSPSSSSTPTWKHIWPARLGIGTHIDEVAHAFALAHPPTTSSNTGTAALQAALVPIPLTPSLNTGYTHWKTRLSGITVYMPSGDPTTTGGGNTTTPGGGWGNPMDVRLSRGVDGGAFPVAVLDSGGANVLASRAVADAVYGVWGIGMGSDGVYYVPCQLVMNITITLATAPPIPIHPLDMSTYVHNDPSSNTCIGTIQVSSQLGTPGGPADIALGISFLRNVYTVHQLDTPASVGTGTYGADTTTPTPRLAIAPLTNPTLALTEFQNVRILNLSPAGNGRAPPPMSGSSSESLGTLSKVALGVGLFALVCVLLFAGRWIVLKRRFNRRRRLGLASHTVSEMGHGGGGGWGRVDGMVDGVAEWAEVIRRKTTLRTKRRKGKEKAGLGGWREVSEVGHEEGLSGHVATRSAVGHGSVRRKDDREASEAFDQIMHNHSAGGADPGGVPMSAGDRRSAELRQGSGPFAGFSLWTFVGAKRLLGPRSGASDHGGRYELTPNPGMKDHVDEGELTEDQLRERRFAAHKRRTERENEPSVWSDVTWVERGDGTLAPSGAGVKQGNLQFNEFGERKMYGYVGTPNETVVGSTTNLIGGKGNEYGFPKDTESDDGSTERGSTLHGSQEFGHLGKAGMAGRGSHSRSGSASREVLPLLGAVSTGMGMASTSSLGATAVGTGMGHSNHRSVPSLELNRPQRLDSSGIITASPYPMTGTPGENSYPFGPFGTPPRMTSGTPPSGTPPRLSTTPPGISATPPRIPSTPPTNSDGFNPFIIPTTIHTPQPPQPQQTLVHPARERMALAVEPSLSPLTEVNSSEFPPSESNRLSIMSALNPAGPQNANGVAGTGPDRRSLDMLERQSSIGALSMESEVLVPLPISLMNLPRSRYSPPPMEDIASSMERRWEDPLPKTQRPADFGRPPVFVPPPPPPAPKTDASRTLPVQKSTPMAHPLAPSSTLPAQPSTSPYYLPIIPAAAPPSKQSATPPPSNMPRSNNPFDMLAFNDFGLGSVSKDSRFPTRDTLSLGTKDSRFPAFTPPSNPPSRPAISLNTRSSSAEPVRLTSVAVPDEAARPRLRTRVSDMELPRPQSEAIGFGAEKAGGLVGGNAGGLDFVEKPWMKPRSQSGGAASLPSMIRNPAPNPPVQQIPAPAAPPAMLDFAPPHNYRPTRPEQRTLPAIGTTREEPRPPLPSRVSEPANASVGMRSRGPRPMVAGPRSSKSTVSPSTPGSTLTHSPPNSPPSGGLHPASSQPRTGTTYDSPLSSASLSTSPTSSLPPGARPPTDPRLHSHHRLPSIPREASSPSIPVTTPPGTGSQMSYMANSPPGHPRTAPIPIPSTHHGVSQYAVPISRETSMGNTENDPEAAYGGMAGRDVPPAGWREDAAHTAGIAGVGARSRFTGPMNQYTSPFDDRS